ncbi:MAG: metal-sulfur cluster assembly factor [Ginsengibacter sp.]
MNEITNNEVKCARALECLADVLDPEIGLNVVDLGLIYQLDFDDAQRVVYCTMTLTTRFCPMGESIQSGVVGALNKAYPGYSADLNVVYNPPWNAERISPRGRDFLNR